MADIIPFNPDQARPLARPNPTDINRACPFCGERIDLFLGEEERPTHHPDGTLMLIETIPTVFCDVCDASAPLDTWNGQRVPPQGAA